MVGLALTAVMACPTDSVAQAPAITLDGTLGTRVGRVGDAYSINGGTVRGSNLFHSFGRFNVPTGGSATFTGPSSTANILSRVTGGEQSTIDGTISTRASMPNANFFLLNPSGVVFTSGAFLDVGGAFRVSTADNIKLADGAVFSATPVAGELGRLTSAPPQAFGFLGSTPASISVEGAALVVDPGQTLSLVGGAVQIVGGVLVAPGGLVQIGSVASPGNALLSAPDLNLGSFPRLGQVTITDGGGITAGTDGILPGGTVVIRSGRLVVDNFAVVTTNTFDLAGARVGIDLGATDSIVLRNGAAVRTESFGAGDASGIAIVTGNLAVTEGAAVESVAFSTGRAGAIDIQVGRADILNGAIRTSSTESRAGDITVAASDTITLSGPTSEISTGTFALDPDILAGNILLTAGNVILGDQARIFSGGLLGQAGETLSIMARDAVMISGLAGISSQAFGRSAGRVDISASRLIMDAGFVNTSTLGAGDAGRVLVTADTVNLTNGAQIASSSQIVATGSGGSITINAPGSVTISGVGPDDGVGSITFTGDPSSGLFSTAQGSGHAGAITINTPVLAMDAGAKASVSTSGTGNAGNIELNLGSFSLTGGARVDSGTTAAGQGGTLTVNAAGAVGISGGAGLFSNAEGSGAGGDINLRGGQIQLLDGGIISTRSSGTNTATAGNVSIMAGTLFRMRNSEVTTEALVADGGNITITTTGSLVHLVDSRILTSVQSGVGQGGNIAISSDSIVLNGSQIRADAFGGPGGNINILADVYLTMDSVVSASSALSTPGTIDIQASVTDVSGSLAQLPESVLEAAQLLRASCAARLATGKSSSLVFAGREGVPLEPGGLLPSPLVVEGPAETGLSWVDGQYWLTLPRVAQPALLAKCAR
jgi:filamentous hemagglutinin family protein